jgi:aspartyl/glutamyl-tRNA(Asn/Gln) amidotransferase C subunit
MEFTEKDLDNLATLARITIAPEEKAKMLKDMQSILGYVSDINSVSGDLARTKADVRNVVRDDVVTHDTGSNTDAILEEAPAREGQYVKVAQVLK